MPTYYTVVQYVPDPVADERINIGVIVFNDDHIRTRFLHNWDRVSRFAQEDISHVRDFSDWARQAAVRSGNHPSMEPLPGLPGVDQLNKETIFRMAEEWSNTLQLSAPQPSLEEPEALLNRMARTHLREPIARQRVFRDRQFAARYAVSSVRRSVSERLGPTQTGEYVHSEYPIGGKVIPNIRVDLAITNSRIYLASQALSFETYNMSDLDRHVRDAVYTLRDVGDLISDVQLYLVALPPKTDLKNFQRAEERFHALPVMCEQIGARLVIEDEVPEWAEQIADYVETRIVADQPRVMHA